MAVAAAQGVVTHNGTPVPPWSETAKEYMVLEKFPHLARQLERQRDAYGREALSPDQKRDLRQLVARRREALALEPYPPLPLHQKVSLLAGGNLAQVSADAVVNASNVWLTSGKGVNGALHSAAGRCLLEECLALGGCDVGQAKMTSGYDLPARHVIHTVGPHGNDKDRAALLRSCYRSCLSLCREHSLRTVAFSCISTGAYCYPAEEAADVALSSVRSWLLEGDNLEHVDRVVFVTRKARDQEAYAGLMMVYFPSPLLA